MAKTKIPKMPKLPKGGLKGASTQSLRNYEQKLDNHKDKINAIVKEKKERETIAKRLEAKRANINKNLK